MNDKENIDLETPEEEAPTSILNAIKCANLRWLVGNQTEKVTIITHQIWKDDKDETQKEILRFTGKIIFLGGEFLIFTEKEINYRFYLDDVLDVALEIPKGK
jgi:hypothetical protein